jgi:hypothetical protein
MIDITMIGSELHLNHQTIHNILTEELGNTHTWMLHHDYAPCHTAISVNNVLTKKGTPVVPISPHSPDLSPCDLFLFPKLKFHLKGSRFGSANNILKVMANQLRALPNEDFQHCCRRWEQLSGGVWLPNGTTLKGMMLVFGSVVNKKFYSTSHITF